MNPFEVLDIKPGASPDEIKTAYHKLAKIYHPDRFTGEEKVQAEERFRKLAEAFNLLKDEGRREELSRRFSAPSNGEAVASPSAEGAAPRVKPLSERTAQDWLDDAKASVEAQDLGRALGLVQSALRLDAEMGEAHRLYAQLLLTLGGDKRARIRALENVIRLCPKDADAMVMLSDAYLEVGLQARAQRMRDEARLINPKHPALRQAQPEKAPAVKAEQSGLGDQLNALLGRFFKKG